MVSYLTILEEGHSEQVIDKSRFIALVFPVKSTQEVALNLEKARQLYPNARHYVYAYRLHEGNLERSADDGEPQGTGGRPVLDVLQFRELWDVLVVVVRYFGGILLGTGGLTRAYGGTARQLLDQTEVSKLIPHAVYEVEASYDWYEPLKYQFRQNNWLTGNEEFSETVRIEVFIPWVDRHHFVEWLAEFTGNQIICQAKDSVLRAESLGPRL
ncbi:YigZ family protein [Desulfitobacterium sp. Sab5]|uniref:YigZ family protein n=1 Tax=Desulfitobacterium nosdiversum TaxID=3375356 RepID=UPI003CE705DF